MCILLFGAVIWWSVLERRILALRWFGMIELGERLLDVSRHGEVDLPLRVVPVECDSDVSSSRPIFGDVVVVLEYVHEMSGVLAAFVLDSEIVDYECELDWSCVVGPEPGH